MNDARNQTPKHHSFQDILRWHGLFVLVGYWVVRLLHWTTPTRVWSKIAGVHALRPYAWDSVHEKAFPWWQDLGVLVHVGLVYVVLKAGFSTNWCLSAGAHIGAWYLLVDILGYHIGVLWFDDLTGESALKRKVWSHRRIFFQAAVNFGESVYLFTLLYHTYQPADTFGTLLGHSFTIATVLSPPDGAFNSVPAWLTAVQVLVSLFFLVVAINVIGSIAYARPELGRTFDDD